MTGIAIATDGQWVSENFERLARVIKDYDPYFELRWIPPDKRTDPGDIDRAFCIVDTRKSVAGVPIMFAAAKATPEDILERLFMGDLHRHGVDGVADRLDAHNAAVKAMQMKKHMDELDEQADLASFLITKAPFYTTIRDPRTGEKIKLDDRRRRI
jgi:hypothetical protein